MKALRMSGLCPATATPFKRDLSFDEVALENHIRETARHDGVNGIVVNGGIGELLTLEVPEQAAIVALTRRILPLEQLVIAGIEARFAAGAVVAAKAARDAGADALLVFPPFDIRAYRKLSTDIPSVLAYFRRLRTRSVCPWLSSSTPTTPVAHTPSKFCWRWPSSTAS